MKILIRLCIVIVLLSAGTVSARVIIPEIPIGTTGNFLAVGNYNVNKGSSDLGTVVQLEANGTILVDEGNPVKFFFNQSDKNLEGVTDWIQSGYNDSDWENGVSGVGYNSIQTTSVLDTNDQGAIYTRYERFNLPNASAISSLTIRIDYDDGVIVWLNGVEVLRANMVIPEAVPNWDWGLSENHESTNKLGPDPTRWAAPASNLFGVGEVNPSDTIIDYTFDVVFNLAPVEPAGKLAASWGSIKANY